MEQAQEEAFGDKTDAGGRAYLAVVAGLVTDDLANGGSEFAGDAVGDQAGG